MQFAPQLAFRGNCREAFEACARLLHGEITVINIFGANEEHALPPGTKRAPPHYIRFAEMSFSGNVLRGNDVNEDDFPPMASVSLSLHMTDVGEAERVFEALSDHETITAPLTEVD